MMNLKQASAITLLGATLFCGGVAVGFNEGSHFGSTVVGINTGFVTVASLDAIRNNKSIGAQNYLESFLDVGLVSGEVLQQNPNWARLGFLLSSADKARLDIYVEKIRKYREANPHVCSEANQLEDECTPKIANIP